MIITKAFFFTNRVFNTKNREEWKLELTRLKVFGLENVKY